MIQKQIIKLDKVPEDKSRINLDLKLTVRFSWNSDICEIYNSPTQPIKQLKDMIEVEWNSQSIPKECKDSYDKFLKAHAESEKQKVKKEIEELENKAKQLKEKLKKL
jgi:gas vesicle protein